MTKTMNNKFRSRGIITIRPKGGMLRCKECGQILGYLQEDVLDYAFLHLVCRCGAEGYLELGSPPPASPDAMADAKGGHLSCPVCYREWFSAAESVRGFSLGAVCSCGVFAENRHQRTREVYEELQILNS